jgi:glucose-1-phosphate thymidylyltransferase
MKAKGAKFYKGEVIEWLDCGNKDATVNTNQRVLENLTNETLVHSSVVLENATVVQPSYLAEGVVIRNAVIGPHVSIGKNSFIENSVVKNSIIQTNTTIKNKLIANAMVGNNVKIEGRMEDWSVGDYNVIIE